MRGTPVYVPYSLDSDGPGVLVAEPREPRIHIPAHFGHENYCTNALLLLVQGYLGHKKQPTPLGQP